MWNNWQISSSRGWWVNPPSVFCRCCELRVRSPHFFYSFLPPCRVHPTHMHTVQARAKAQHTKRQDGGCTCPVPHVPFRELYNAPNQIIHHPSIANRGKASLQDRPDAQALGGCSYNRSHLCDDIHENPTLPGTAVTNDQNMSGGY